MCNLPAQCCAKNKMIRTEATEGVTDRRWHVLAQEVKPATRLVSCSLELALQCDLEIARQKGKVLTLSTLVTHYIHVISISYNNENIK